MLIYKTDAGQFAMSHGSYDSNLGSEILILGGDIRSRSWLNISDTYGMPEKNMGQTHSLEFKKCQMQ